MSSGFSHPSLEPKRRLRFQTESNPPLLVSTNTASGFSGFSAVSATASHSSTCDNVVHSVQLDMRNLIRQILTEELRSTNASRKRSRSLSSSEGRDRRVRRNSPSLSNPSNMDKTSQSTCNTDSTEVEARGPGAKRLQSPLIIFSLLFRNRKYCSDRNLERKLTILVMNGVIKRMRSLTIWYRLH